VLAKAPEAGLSRGGCDLTLLAHLPSSASLLRASLESLWSPKQSVSCWAHHEDQPELSQNLWLHAYDQHEISNVTQSLKRDMTLVLEHSYKCFVLYAMVQHVLWWH